MSEVNDYAKQLLSRAKKPAGRQAGWTRQGSVLAGKSQTPWEATVTSGTLARNKARWDELFAKPLNKWKPQQ